MTSEILQYDAGEHGLLGIRAVPDPFGATVTSREEPLALGVRFRVADDEWRALGSSDMTATDEGDALMYAATDPEQRLRVQQGFRSDGHTLDWEIALENLCTAPIEVGDLWVSLPVVTPDRRKPAEWNYENGFTTHPFIAGSGSFLYYTRASGAPPFLIVTVRPGTHLEYFDHGGASRHARFHVHSGASGPEEQRGDWRFEHTSLHLAPRGQAGATACYGFRLQFAVSYDAMRDILFQEGLFDIRAVPGMTIPEDLTARISLHTRARIESVEAEFPEDTTITPLDGAPQDHHLYEIAFRRLGENMLTVRHDGGRRTHLEYFVTEPLETLIKKRAAFIVDRQQVRDPEKWWDGVYGPYDMKTGTVRTIDDPDIFTRQRLYVLTCDDPGLCKPPYIAAKNVAFPDRKEIESLEYYLEHFVWGKLQRTDTEEPYPYGIYGTPHWYINRDPARRRAYTDQNLDKEHVWRSYDYPHFMMLYYHLYEIARKYPAMTAYLTAAGYLERAWGTAKAYFEYPYRIIPTYYETYKMGCYNELIIPALADALETEGFPDRAAFLREEWEKKVKYYVYDNPYPYPSEFTFDRTAFETTHALAKYGATRDMRSDRHLWWDVKCNRWYSHPLVRREDSRIFMERQLAANLAVRGWLEASYHQLGGDPGLSYMAAMGGWGILDYAVNFSDQPADWLQLGYASYLSSWALMNTGRPETDYGFWARGKENDGAAGWQFMAQKFGHAWMGEDVSRGPWRYDGEIDLGFGGALRMAATVVTRDPVFGWIAYGGTLRENGDQLDVVPRDGLRQRFAALMPEQGLPWAGSRRFKMELDRDGFISGEALCVRKDLSLISFMLENRTGDAHETVLRLAPPPGFGCEVLRDGEPVALRQTGDWEYPWRTEIAASTSPCHVQIALKAW